MGFNVGNLPVKQVYIGSTPVTAVYVGAQKVWPTTDVVQITLGTGNEARDQLRAALSARGLYYLTVTEIPFEIELVGTGSTQAMFSGQPALTSVPDMDTSQVTNMRSMFNGCNALTYVPNMHTSQVTDMAYMFTNCSSLTYVPDMDTAQVTNMNYMFTNCSSLTDGNVRLIGRNPNVTTSSMITGSGLTREPFYDAADPPQRVTVETDAVGWFPTVPTHPLIAGVNEYSEISFTTAVWANKPMRDYDAGVTYPARSVIPAGSYLYVPDTNIPVKVTFTEHVPAFPPRPVSVGLAGPHDWEEYTLAEYQGVLADMTSMGMKRIRISALWDRIESTKGTYWWNQIDMLVNTAVAAGIQPLVVLLGVPSWARPNFETTARGFRPEWEAFCTAVATRYAGVVPAYEIWNEPNLDRFWLNGSASTFHDVLSRAVTKIKAADPNAVVISGGLAPAVNSADETEPLDFIEFLYTQNALQGVDGIGWHPYSFPELPSGTSEWNTFRKMDDLKDLIVDNQHAAQIWITEIGAPTGGDAGVGEAAQSAIIDDGLNLAAEDPLMGPVFVYTHKDLHLGEGDMESWFGIYTSTGAPKPAVAAIQAITATRRT